MNHLNDIPFAGAVLVGLGVAVAIFTVGLALAQIIREKR
jgi:hypothetical protein